MEQEVFYFGENGIIKSAFHKYKKPININEVDIEEIVLYCDKNIKYINLLVNDKEILERYSEIWNKIKGLIKK